MFEVSTVPCDARAQILSVLCSHPGIHHTNLGNTRGAQAIRSTRANGTGAEVKAWVEGD